MCSAILLNIWLWEWCAESFVRRYQERECRDKCRGISRWLNAPPTLSPRILSHYMHLWSDKYKFKCNCKYEYDWSFLYNLKEDCMTRSYNKISRPEGFGIFRVPPKVHYVQRVSKITELSEYRYLYRVVLRYQDPRAENIRLSRPQVHQDCIHH